MSVVSKARRAAGNYSKLNIDVMMRLDLFAACKTVDGIKIERTHTVASQFPHIPPVIITTLSYAFATSTLVG